MRCSLKKVAMRNSFSLAPIDSTGALEWLPTPAPIESMGAESSLQGNDLILKKYAYL